MANISKLDYSTINRPYDNNLRRGGEALTPSSAQMINGPAQISPKAIQGATLEDLWINTWFKSTNYKPKKQGFLIDGMNGYIEAMNLYISGSIVGGSLHIPDKTTTNSFHVSTIGDMWIGANVVNKANAPFKVSEAGVITSISGTIGGWTLGATTLSATNAGNTTTLSSGATSFSSGPTGSPTTTITQAGILTCAGAVIDGTSTIGGRDGSDLATAINSSSNLVTDIINARLNTSSKYILSDFDFGSTDYAGAVKAGDIAWNTTTGAITSGSGIAIYRKGIVGANAGATTFSIDATTGSAYFAGEIVADTGIIGGWTLGELTLKSYNDEIELYAGDASNTPHIKIFSEGSTNPNDYAQFTGGEDPLQVNVGIPRLGIYRDTTETGGNVRTQYGKVLWFYTKYQTGAYDPCPQTQIWTKDGKEWKEEFEAGPADKDGVSVWMLNMKSAGDASIMSKAQILFYGDSTVPGVNKGEINIGCSVLIPNGDNYI